MRKKLLKEDKMLNVTSLNVKSYRLSYHPIFCRMKSDGVGWNTFRSIWHDQFIVRKRQYHCFKNKRL